MKDQLIASLKSFEANISSLSEERKEKLLPLVYYILDNQRDNDPSELIFVCTHNARRSHMAQLWAAAAALYCDLENIETFSGGIEVTRIHPNALASLERSGFEFSGDDDGKNPSFLVQLGESIMLEVFSKAYGDDTNPQKNFAAVLVCSEVAEACPNVEGASLRLPISYDDPKEFDGSEKAEEMYDKRSVEIGTEMLYVMKTVSEKLAS
ncbi:protein-tyrosine-phosphatase [Salibacteraceae bacterium]|mgnify:CR=1 FL=1|jgi:arsenate reductase|nr:protein-tyrosine-phosphatase [Salibacteraceae bacterium]MDB4104993.1 protein-tyrosine-phosphatase [Salibacteraceae bacterium]MDB9708764.1 protein-tyrosine-phosphatase [Salibacteraceae bacterium]MDC1304528.1 protein-tyrosine-phosphatase [Salibacteraceae bacterium]